MRLPSILFNILLLPQIFIYSHGKSLFVQAGGSDDADCGSQANPCSMFPTDITLTDIPVYVLYSSNAISLANTVTFSGDCSVIGIPYNDKLPTMQTRYTTSEAYFVFENGNTFAFEKLNISINAIPCPLLYAKGGIITLTQDVFVSVRAYLFLLAPVLSLTSCDVYISNVNVTNLASNGQGVIYLENVTGYIYNTRLTNASQGSSSPLHINITSTSAMNNLSLGIAPTDSSSVDPSLIFDDTNATATVSSSIQLIWEECNLDETNTFPVEFGEVVFDRPDEYDHDQISVEGDCACSLIENETLKYPSLKFDSSKCADDESLSLSSSESSTVGNESESDSENIIYTPSGDDRWKVIVIIVVGVLFVIIMIVIVGICIRRKKEADEEERGGGGGGGDDNHNDDDDDHNHAAAPDNDDNDGVHDDDDDAEVEVEDSAKEKVEEYHEGNDEETEKNILRKIKTAMENDGMKEDMKEGLNE